MKYRLSLDLGVGSIGSAVLELDENNRAIEIIDTGVCVFCIVRNLLDRVEATRLPINQFRFAKFILSGFLRH